MRALRTNAEQDRGAIPGPINLTLVNGMPPLVMPGG
jgi:hypothetical protein